MVKKLLTFIFLIILLTVPAVLVFGPNYAKSYLENNSKELVGRQILMDELDFNAFNGHFLITNLRVLEEQDSGIFVQFDSLFTDLKLYKLFGGEFLTEALHIKGLEIDVWKQNERFNFEDLIPETDSTLADTTIETEESFIKKFTINDIQILYSSVNYDDRDLPAIHNLKDINIKVPGITFGDEETKAGLEFALAEGGVFKLDIDYNLPEKTYACDMSISNLDLHPFLVYTESSLEISDLKGWFGADIHVKGDLDNPAAPTITGSMNLNDFALTDKNGIEAVNVSSVFINAKEINLEKNVYHFGSLQLNRPIINVVQYAKYDNLSTLVKETPDSTSVEQIKVESDVESAPLQYLLEEFRLQNGEINYTDAAIANGPFKYSISEINFSADSLTEGRNVTFNMDAIMNAAGTLKGLVIADPGNPAKGGTFDLDLNDIPIEDFSVFSLNSTAYPIIGGRLSFQTKNKVLDNKLNSHLIMKLYKTNLGDKRNDVKPEYNVPMKLGVMVLEDPKKLILIDVPAEGDLDDPEFKYSKLVWKVVMNVLIKAATSPYNLLAGAVGAEEDDIKFIRFELLQWELGPEQTAQIDMISDILVQKPGINVQATQVLDVAKERKLIQDYLAKKGYFLHQNYGSDSAKIDLDPVDRAKILHLDETPEIIAFLETKTNAVAGTLSFYELADLYVPKSAVDETHQRILTQRAANMKQYITSKELTERFLVMDEWKEDVNRNKPRFEMVYEVKEE